MVQFRTLEDLPSDRRVLVRLDLNSPVQDGRVQDNRRFGRHAETVADLADMDHRVVVLAHQGRPGRDDFVSLREHAGILSEHLDRRVRFVSDTYGQEALDAIEGIEPGEVLLLENTRMTDDELPERPPEEHAASEFVQTLAAAVDLYVNDAYSTAHRRHASLVGFPVVLPAYAGRVMTAEYEANTAISSRSFDGPVTMIVGGVKATDVITVMDALDDRVDRFLLGGVAGELFLRADGDPVGHDVEGTDLFDDQWQANEATIRRLLSDRRAEIELPQDLAYAGPDGARSEVVVDELDRKTAAFRDIGERTITSYRSAVRDSAAVFLKGALGVFEDERFADGTVDILRAIADTDCFSVIGGGDTSRAVELYDFEEEAFSHVSIAGGAYIRALTGESLPAVDLLERNAAGEFDV